MVDSKAALILTDLAIVGGLALLGGLIVLAVRKRPGLIEVAALGFPLGAGSLTFATFLLMWAGVELRGYLPVIVYLGLATLLVVAIYRRRPVGLGGLTPGVNELSRKDKWAGAVALLLFVGLTLLAGYISVGRSHSNYDTAAMWVVKGYGLAREGNLAGGAGWGGHGLSYPLNIHLLVSFYRLATGDLHPGSQLLFVSFQASALLGCFAYWLKRGVPVWLASAGLVFLSSVPVVFLHATIGFANLAMALYMALGTAWAVEGIVGNSSEDLVLGGLLLGLGSWTILEGFIFTAVCLAVLIAGWLWLGRRGSIGWLLTPAVAVTGIWLTFYLGHGASGSQAAGAADHMISSWRSGDLNLVELRLIFGYLRRYLFHLDLWGLLFIVGPVLLILNWRRVLDREHLDLRMLSATAAGTGLLSCLLFYLRSFEGLDLFAWLVRGFPRQFLVSALIFGILIIAAAGGPAARSWQAVGRNDRQPQND